MSALDWRQFPLFAELEPADRVRLAELLEERRLASGEVLCEEGSDAEGAFLLASGALDCTRSGLAALGRIEAPALLGVAALAGPGPREASLTAAEPSRVLLLSRSAFQRFAAAAAPAAVRVLEGAVCELGGLLRSGIDVLPRSRG